MATIEGEYKRVARKKRRKAASNNVGSIGTDLYDALNTDPYPPLSTAKTGNQSLLDQFKQKYAEAVANFQAASDALDESETLLLSVADDAQNSPYAANWQSNYDKVIAAQATRNAVFNDIDTVRDFIETSKQKLGLSAAFVVPWSVVAAIGVSAGLLLAAANGAVVAYNLIMRWKYDQINLERVQNGETPLDYPQEMSTGFGAGISGIFGNLQNVAQMAIIGVVLFFVLTRN